MDNIHAEIRVKSSTDSLGWSNLDCPATWCFKESEWISHVVRSLAILEENVQIGSAIMFLIKMCRKCPKVSTNYKSF